MSLMLEKAEPEIYLERRQNDIRANVYHAFAP